MRSCQLNEMGVEKFVKMTLLTPLRNICEKFGREGKNPEEIASTPSGVFGWRNTLVVCGLKSGLVNIFETLSWFKDNGFRIALHKC